MNSPIGLFMEREWTCLPSLINKYLTKYYNNGLANYMTWVFFIWLFLHLAFDKLMNALLRQMKLPEYLRQRLTTTLWNLAFSFSSFVYCLLSLSAQNFHFSDVQTSFLRLKEASDVSGQYMLGFIILCTYFAQMALWEGSKGTSNDTVLKNAINCGFAMFTYWKGWCEIFFALIAMSNLTQTTLEVSKIFSFQIYNRRPKYGPARFWFILHLTLCFVLYFLIVPLQFVIPAFRHFRNEINAIILLLNLFLWGWFAVNVFQSVVFKIIKHYVYHMNDRETECGLNILECCIFEQRCDTVYEVMLLKKEMARRDEALNLQRKKPNKVALYQTLKCMVAVKRKLKQRRSSNDEKCSSCECVSPTHSEQLEMQETASSAAAVNDIVDELLDNVNKHK